VVQSSVQKSYADRWGAQAQCEKFDDLFFVGLFAARASGAVAAATDTRWKRVPSFLRKVFLAFG
jgi:hypothetical protein